MHTKPFLQAGAHLCGGRGAALRSAPPATSSPSLGSQEELLPAKAMRPSHEGAQHELSRARHDLTSMD